jgi:3-hydroxybutyryl-CoA dehydrogenase
MHFMNPVPKKSAVEVIRAELTSDETIEKACGLLGQLDKRAIIVSDSPGFVTNRILMLTINEAIAVIEEGVSSPRNVDDIFVSCFSHAMGPLATADLIGLDTILYSLDELYDSFQDQKFVARALLRDMVANGTLGRKTGHGFFNYDMRSQSK